MRIKNTFKFMLTGIYQNRLFLPIIAITYICKVSFIPEYIGKLNFWGQPNYRTIALQE